ncbi:MAG TPA: hypothetical protein VHP33_28100 [Polyangiaceae bacterium]|nr:hypothetical protein [Polyangiaceae bacterium]
MSAAAEQLRTAEEQLSAAQAALVVARERFLRKPTMQHEEQVEDAERGVRRAERFRDARTLALEQANAAAKLAQQTQAREQRAGLLEQRVEIRRGVQERLRDVAALYTNLNVVVEALDKLVQDDARVCRAFNELGTAANDNERRQPLNVESLRLALNFELGQAWDDKPHGDADVVDAVKAAGRLGDPGTGADFYRRLENVIAEAEHAFGAAPLCRWLSTLREPDWNDHSPAAERARQAMKLREQLLEKQP